MENLSKYLNRQKVETQARSHWEELVGRFCDAYNATTEKKYQMTYKRMATKLSPLLKENGINWLEGFYKECSQRDNFGKWFNWSLSNKNVKS